MVNRKNRADNEEVNVNEVEAAPARAHDAHDHSDHDHSAAQAEATPALPTEPENPSRNTEGVPSGEVTVKYVGKTSGFLDQQTGKRFAKGRAATVSASDAERLTSLGGDQPLFVRADN